MANETRKKLYTAVNNAGFDVGNYDDFDKRMNNAEDRKKFYDAVNDAGFDIGDYNDYERRIAPSKYNLTIGGKKTPVSEKQYKDFVRSHSSSQPASGTQQPQARKAQAKPQTSTLTTPTQGGFAMPEGFGEADFSRGVQSPFLQEQERKAHAHDKQLAKQGLLGRTEQQKREASAKAQAKTVQKAIQGDEDAVAETGLDSATQQLRDRMDYYNATGKELKDDVLDLTSIGIAPTVARDENGEIMRNEDGTVIKGQVSDPVRAATQAMDSERMRVADLDRQIEEANDELLNLKKEIDKIETPRYVYSQDALSPYADPRTTNTDLASLSVAYTQLQEKLKGLQVERAGGQKGFFNGMLTAAKDPSTWLLGLDKLSNTAEMLRVSEKVKSGKELTDSEKKMLDATMANNAVQGKLSEDSDWLYRAGAMTTQMLPFALQIGFTGGFGSVAEMGATGGEKLAARYAAKYGEEALINRVNANIIKGLGVTFGDVAAGFCNAVTTGAANTAVDAMERRIGDLGVNEKGEYQFTGDDDWIRAIGKAIVSQTKEFATERFGEHLPSLREMNVWFAKQGMGARKIARALSGFAGTKAMQNTAAFLRKGGINGVGGEILEEEIGLPIDVAIGDMTWEDALSGKTQWDICGGMLLSMGAMHATGLAAQGVGKTYNTAQYYKYKNRADKSAHKAATMMGNDAWRAMQEKIDGTETQNMETVWEDIRNNESLSDKEKRAAFDYMNALTLMRGYNMGMFFSASEAAKNPALMAEVKPTTKKEQDEIDVMQSRDRGYNLETPQEQNDAKNMRDYARQQLEGHVSGELISRIDEDPLGTLEIIDNSDLSDEAKQKARDYVNAKATYDGMIQSVRDRIETETQQATEEIDSRVASEEQGGDGKIHPATMKADNRQVYIVSGNVRMLDDGSMVDRENSDKDLIVRDAETGKVEFVSIDDILRTDEVEDAEQLKQEAVQNIQETVATEASNAIDGVLSFEPNSNFTIMSDDGAEHTVQVVQDQGDGTVAVLIDGATDAVPMVKEQLQEMSEAYNMSRLQQYEAEKAVERAEEAQEQSETAEGAEEVAEGAEGTQAQETPAQEEEPMPMIGEGEDAEPDFASVTPERAHKYVYEESGLDEQTADEFVGNNLKAAQKELDKAKSKTPKMGTSISQYNKAKQEYDANVNAAQQRVDYWNQLKSEHDNTIAQRNAERAAERKAIEEREKAKAEAEEAARQAEITARQEEEQARGALFHKASEEASEVSEQEGALRDALVETMRNAGIEVVADETEGQRVLDMVNGENATLSKAQKRAAETASLNHTEGSPADISTADKKNGDRRNSAVGEDNRHTPLDISNSDGAKLLKNIDNLARKYEEKSNRPKNFINDVAKVLGTVGSSSSRYASFITKNGQKVTIRLSNHNATVSNFDNVDEDNGISIVISGTTNNGIKNNGNAHIVEFFYPEKKLRKADGKPLADIVRAIKQSLYSGEFNDPTGLAERQEVNDKQIRLHKVFHGSGADFDAFDHSFIGTGEGNQAFGWGTYVSEVEGVGRGYAKRIGDMKVSERKFIEGKIEEARKYNIPAQVEYWENELEKKNLGDAQHYLYEVEIPEDDGSNYIDYFAKMQDQQGVLDKIDNYMTNNEVYGFRWKRQNPDQRIQFRAGSRLITLTPNQSGADMYEEFKDAFGAKPASEILHAMGITGIKVPVNAMRGGNENGEMNFVIFNEEDAKITDKVRFFRTENGKAYGFVKDGKIYIDPSIATSETPIHEYTHLWAEALRKGNPEKWEEIKRVLLNDESVKPFIDEVRKKYPELTNEDDLLDEVLAQYSGKRGSERLRAEAQRIADSKDGAFEKADVFRAMNKLKDAIRRFWQAFADFMHIPYRNADEIADRVMYDLLSGVNPKAEAEKMQQNPHKARQLEIVTKENPMRDDYHTGIRSIDDIKTYEEAVNEGEGMGMYPDFTEEDARKALESGEVTVYSSYPIENGVFVSTSRKEAEDYAGGGKVYSKRVPLSNVAWLYANEGQYAEVDDEGSELFRDEEENNNEQVEEDENTMQREGDGRVLSMSQDKNYSRKQRWELMQREWKRMQNKAKELIDILKLDRIAVYGTVEDMPEGMRNSLSERKKKAKGWYDTKTGKIVIILGNHRNAEDVAKTILHEAVAHYGLRRLFGKNFDTFLDNVYQNADIDVKMRIADMAARQRAKDSAANRARRTTEDYLRIGTEEYLAKLAEDMDFENRHESFWSKIKSLFIQMLESIGLKDYEAGELSDNELRYILWRSYKNLSSPGEYRNVFDVAEDVVMQENLGVGNYAESQGETMTEQMQAAEQGMVGEEAVNGTALYETLNRKYNGKDYDIIDTQTISDEELYDVLGGTEDERAEITDEEFHSEINKIREHIKNAWAVYNYKTKKMLIFANEISKDNAEEIFFHENIHAILDEWYGDTLRGIAERFWEIAPDDGKVSKDYIKRHYPEEKQKEELFTYWLARSMRDGDVDAMVSMFDDAGDVARINTILNTFDYVKGRETSERAASRKAAGSKSGIKEKKPFGENNITSGEVSINEDDRFNDADDGEIASEEELNSYDAGRMSLSESITQGLIKLARENKDNLQLRVDAMRALNGDIQKLRSAMSRQRDYDRSTVDSIVRLARMVMGTGYFNNFSNYEVRRLLSAINNATGKEDITHWANTVVDILMQHQLREAKELFERQMRVRGSKVDSRGVEVQAGLDITGQRIVSAFKDAMEIVGEETDSDGNLTAWGQRIADVYDRMGSDDEVTAQNAAAEYQGMMLAKQWYDEVRSLEQEEKNLRADLKDAEERKRNGQMTHEEYKQFVKATEDAIRENRMERIEGYGRLAVALGTEMRTSVEKAKAFREEAIERVNEIHHNANSDLEGIPADEHRKLTWQQSIANWSIVRFFMKPLATFDEMLRFFGSKSVDGKGYLWNRFMCGWTDAADREWKQLKAAHEILDKKASEVFGKNMKWSDIFSMERKMPTITVEFWDGGERKSHQLTAGNALYIYMVNKMTDGKMKLRKMGITEEDVANIAESLDPRLIQLADWLQDDFLVNKRKDYNAVHERMFGAPMAAIDNYFPLRINDRSRGKEEEIGAPTTAEARPSTVTGSVIKRVRNTTALDIMGTDAFDVVLEHLQEMEHWAAFAELSRDLNTLCSYKRFRNRVLNMSSVRFGAGETLWKNFKDCCAIAAGVYTPMVNRNSLDTAMVNVAKGVTAAKISFRIYTALKQLLSYPAYLSEANIVELAKTTLNPVGAAQSWNWAIENLPGFAERWQSRRAGDSRLLDTDADWQYWRNKIVETASRWGMSPNAFIDGLTVSMGAKAIYETKKKRYLSAGYSEEEAEKKALLDASVAYNETQQSSMNAYLSAMQVDRTAASVALTVFRNASMAYQRRMFRAMSNLKRKMRRGYKNSAIEYMAKQYQRNGLGESEAQASATRDYNHSWYEDVANTVIFGFVMQFAWNLGPYLVYMIGGDDDDDKEDSLVDATLHALAGGVEGLTGGSVMSELYNMLRKGESIKDYNFNLLPLMSDVQNILRKLDKDKVGAANDIINLLVQAGIGVNPQSLTDAFVAIMDYSGGDYGHARETALLILRIMNCPQSQLDKLMIDELGMTARDAQKISVEEMADRYAEYKVRRDAPLTGWAYSDEGEYQAAKPKIKSFNDKVGERVKKLSDEDLESAFNRGDNTLRKLAGKEAAERMGGKDTYGSPSKKDLYGQVYKLIRDYNDLAEDILLHNELKKAKQKGDTDRVEEIDAAIRDITNIKKDLAETPFTLEDGTEVTDKDVMKDLRELRKEYIKEFVK